MSEERYKHDEERVKSVRLLQLHLWLHPSRLYALSPPAQAIPSKFVAVHPAFVQVQSPGFPGDIQLG